MAKSSGFQSRIRYGIAAMVLILGVGVGSLVWQVAESTRARRTLVIEGNEALARVASTLAAIELGDRLQAVGGLASRPDVVQLAAEGRWEFMGQHLQGIRQLDPDLASAEVLDGQGRLRASDPEDPSVMGKDFSGRDYYQGAISTNGPYLSEVFRQSGAPSAVVMGFSTAIRDPYGKILGVLQSTLPVSKFDVISSKVAVPYGGSIVVFDHGGHAVGTPGDASLQSFAEHPLVAKALAGKSGVAESLLPGLDDIRFVSYSPVPVGGWAVMVGQPRSAALKSIEELTIRLGAVGGLVALMGMAIAIILIRLIRALNAERTTTAAILSSAGEAIATTDTEGIVETVNPAMEQLSGWSEREVVGRPYHEVFHLFDSRGELLPPEERALSKAMQSGAPVGSQGYELMLARKDGERVPVAITAAPVFDDQGKLVGGVDVIRDVGEEREVDQMKSALISTVSHELRTPLTMIQGFSELLLSRDLDQHQSREAVEKIHASAERLGRLIDDLLSVSRIESGSLVVRKGPVDLRAAVVEVASDFRNREVTVDVDEQLPRVLADRDMLLQILTNLISNAVKYSPPSSAVAVTAKQKGSSIEVCVIDAGIGLTQDEQQRLFEKFYRVERSEVQEVGGTGLGLFITRSLVEILGGQIWVKSNPEDGSTFAFTVPVDSQTSKERELEEAIDR